jgi:hypothetical protein
MSQLPDLRPYSHFWDRHETLKHLRDIADARMVVPWALLGVTMARVLSAVPYNIVLPPIIQDKASLNAFFALTGPSGSGKSGSIGCSYSYVQVDNESRRENLGTGEGLAMVFLDLISQGPGQPKILVRNQTMGVVYMVDEITTLGELGSRDGATIQSVLRSAWSGGQIGQKNADSTRDRKVEAHDYRLVMICGVQPRRSSVIFREEGSGSPQRFFWLPTVDEYLEYDEANLMADTVVNNLHIALPLFPQTAERQFRVCDTARLAIKRANIQRQRNQADALDGHLLLCQLKAAAALALMCVKSMDISEFWWETAGILMEVSNLTRTWAAGGAYDELRAMARQEGSSYGIRADAADQAKVNEICERVGGNILHWLDQYPDGASQSTVYRHISAGDRKGIFPDKFVDADGNTVNRMLSNFELAWECLYDSNRITVVGVNRNNKPLYARTERATEES